MNLDRDYEGKLIAMGSENDQMGSILHAIRRIAQDTENAEVIVELCNVAQRRTAAIENLITKTGLAIMNADAADDN